MNLTNQINDQLKSAMKAKDQVTLRGLRAIKAALLILQTQEGGGAVNAEDEMIALVKMAKQRKDSIRIFKEQGRDDLATIELEELAIIEKFLPAQLSEAQVANEIKLIIEHTGAAGMKDMGKVMGMANGKLKGRADGKLIADIVKELLT